jgi:hypothetical protein
VGGEGGDVELEGIMFAKYIKIKLFMEYDL